MIKKLFQDVSLESILDNLKGLSFKQKLLILAIVWALIFVPSIINHSYSQRSDHYQFYPEESGPDNYSPLNWNVTTSPVKLDNTTTDGLLSLKVNKDDKVEFRWVWNKDPSQGSHIGTVDVLYKTNGSEWNLIRLRRSNSSSLKEVWSREKEFKEDKEIQFYFRIGQTDIPTYARRTSIILEGKNPYEETRTGPPPLIHFLFIPPTVLSAPMSMGGVFLSFNIYFSLFVFFDSLLLFYSVKRLDESKAFLSSLIFILNPITILTVHQDEPIILFLMILPLFLLIRSKKYLSSISIGLGAVAKIWTAFWIPVLMTAEGIKKLKYVIVVIISSLSVFSIFLLVWGEKVLWFLTFYGGTAGKQNIGGISFWNYGLKFIGLDGSLLPTTSILIMIAFVELFVWGIAWKKGWRPISMLIAFSMIFLAFYPKIHWEYILLLLPFLSILASEKAIYLEIFYIVTIVPSITMYLGTLGDDLAFLPFITAVLLSLLFMYVVLRIYKEDGKISEIDFDL